MDEIFAWAKIALTLLSSEPHSCQTFVAKYIAKIQEELPNISYNHIHGCKNLNVCGLAIRTTELWTMFPWSSKISEPLYDKPSNVLFECKDIQAIVLKEE